MCSGMVFTASGMLTKQTLVQHPFGNAADGFRNAVDGSRRPGMGSMSCTELVQCSEHG